jgi:hypothetical protein
MLIRQMCAEEEKKKTDVIPCIHPDFINVITVLLRGRVAYIPSERSEPIFFGRLCFWPCGQWPATFYTMQPFGRPGINTASQWPAFPNPKKNH